MRFTAFCALCCLAAAAFTGSARADDLVVDGTNLTLDDSSPRRYDNICIINGGSVTIVPYTKGADKQLRGNLELIAGSVKVDATSSISVRGAGYRGQLCDAGDGMTSTAGGRGGCSVMDSGGGGAHFGRGGRGTIDRPTAFPRDFEDDCGNHFDDVGRICKNASDTTGGSAASGYGVCNLGGNGQPPGASVAGLSVWHNIYQPEFGAAGGDKGCRDGDGWDSQGDPTPSFPVPMVAGAGGGRVVLVGLSERGSAGKPSPCGVPLGTVQIDGTVDADGKRGCGTQNDSGGGGAGGTVLIVGDHVVVSASAKISAAGGLGGDTRAGAVGQPDYTDCPGTQTSGLCDDCGGGGGGGIIRVLSGTSQLDPQATFDVSGGKGGTCSAASGDSYTCQGESGGGAGELQLDGAYVGEYCDGYDNDFDGNVDEGLGDQSCGLGSCSQSIASCSGGVPVTCEPSVDTDSSCKATADNARPRVAVVLDTSGSMLLNLKGYPTFGDGSVEHPGIAGGGDSRLFLAREALSQVISAYPEIDFALARYHQDQALDRSCQTAAWFECQGLVASYDEPSDNTGSTVCNVAYGPDGTQSVAIRINPNGGGTRTQCINYAGSCGPPRRGADILSGFGTPVRDMVRWMDGKETAFDPSTTPGDVCAHSQGNDCELRGSGPTPLAGSLQAIADYVTPIRAEDGAAACRGYDVILVTDGAESCNGDPVAAASQLLSAGIKTHVVAVSVLDEEKASLSAIAAAGGTGAATFVTQPEDLVPALSSIVAGAIRYESCNGKDDDCDTKIDEDFPGLGSACDDHNKGVCRSTGTIACNATQDGTECKIDMPGQSASDEKCNSLDDDCDGAVDEGLDCQDRPCTPKGGEVCNNVDDDCDGKIDETDPAVGNACGKDVGECRPGTTRCVLGELRCIGGVTPSHETCNGRDDDCNGEIDDMAPCPPDTACIEGACRNRCAGSEFSCPIGQLCVHSEQYMDDYCVPSACAVCKSTERCDNDVCVDPCAGVSCDDGQLCVRGECHDCTVAGCPSGQICYQRQCQDDACAGVHCDSGEFCFNGQCRPECDDSQCAAGQACGESGVCEDDPCALLSCADGQACRQGQCETDVCRTMACGAGDVCVSQLGCVPDPCAVTVCAADTLCSVGPHGEPRCTSPGRVPPKRSVSYVSSGGSGLGCSAAEPGGGPPSGTAGAWLAGLLGLLWWRRRRGVRRGGRRALACALGALTLLAGCKTDAICLDCTPAATSSRLDAGRPAADSGGLISFDDGGTDDDGGPGRAGGSASNGTCIPLGDEVCNGLDDDCDGMVDEDFDFMTNVRHCGGCDQPCSSDNAQTRCEAGQCVVGECLAGFADLDGEPGCEYRCPVFPLAAEDCNGVDDDCDGKVDEALSPPSASAYCRHTANTPCANVGLVCDTREGMTTWFCDYPQGVEFDPVVTNGIVAEETRCDGIDNDCDGRVDEPWPELGTPCDDGKAGACRDGGAMVCASDEKGTRCDLSLPPDPVPGAGPDAVEVCNDIDDNCDGIVDNPDPSDPKHVVDAMVPVSHAGHDYYIYTYEASRPDASDGSAGIVTARACSRPDVQPWTFVSYQAAAAACAASGKRLCTADEWLWACQGSGATAYPYGASYVADSCNGADHDTQPGGGIDNATLATGGLASCVSEVGAYDLSGNVKEWVDDQRGTTGAPSNEPIYVVRGGSYQSPQLGLTCQTELSQATASTVLAGLGFRCCSDATP